MWCSIHWLSFMRYKTVPLQGVSSRGGPGGTCPPPFSPNVWLCPPSTVLCPNILFRAAWISQILFHEGIKTTWNDHLKSTLQNCAEGVHNVQNFLGGLTAPPKPPGRRASEISFDLKYTRYIVCVSAPKIYIFESKISRRTPVRKPNFCPGSIQDI